MLLNQLDNFVEYPGRTDKKYMIMLKFVNLALAQQCSEIAANQSGMKDDLIGLNLTLLSVSKKIDRVFDKLDEVVCTLGSELVGNKQALVELSDLWGKKLCEMTEQIENGNIATVTNVKRMVSNFKCDIKVKLEELNVSSANQTAMGEQFKAIDSKLQEICHRQGCTAENCQTILDELRTVKSQLVNMTLMFEGLAAAVSVIRSEVSGIAGANTDLYNLWGQKFSNLQQQIENGNNSTVSKVQRLVEEFKCDIEDKLEELKVSNGCHEALEAQFTAIDDKLSEMFRGQTVNLENCQQVLAELRDVKLNLLQVLQLSHEHKKDFDAGMKMLRTTVLNVNQRTYPSTFVILDPPTKVQTLPEPPPPPATKSLIQSVVGKVGSTMSRGLDKTSDFLHAISNPTSALISALHNKQFLALICESCRAPSGNPYEITNPREVVSRILPLARAGLKFVCVINTVSSLGRLFGLATPVIEQGTLQSWDHAIATVGSSSLIDFSAMHDAVGNEGCTVGEEMSMNIGSCARSFEQFLLAVDPHNHWGGLSAVVTPDGEVVFVCPTCANHSASVSGSAAAEDDAAAVASSSSSL